MLGVCDYSKATRIQPEQSRIVERSRARAREFKGNPKHAKKDPGTNVMLGSAVDIAKIQREFGQDIRRCACDKETFR